MSFYCLTQEVSNLANKENYKKGLNWVNSDKKKETGVGSAITQQLHFCGEIFQISKANSNTNN